MASEVEICNLALQKLGAKRITSLTQDSANARSCNVAYASVRDRELRAHPWSFAIRREALAADSVAPDWGRQNSFQLPSDFLALYNPYPDFNPNDRDWEIEGRKILTNDDAPLNVRIIVQVTDPNLMDPLFRDVVSIALAQQLCEEITQSNSKKDALQQEYKDAIAKARKANAFDKIAAQPPDDVWLTARL